MGDGHCEGVAWTTTFSWSGFGACAAAFRYRGQNSLAMAATQSALRCDVESIRFCLTRDPACGLPARALRASGVTDFDLLFTHCHYDHIIGLPFFAPIYDRSVKVTLWSGHLAGRMTTRQMVDKFMRPPWFPVKLDDLQGKPRLSRFRVRRRASAARGRGGPNRQS